MSNRFQYEYDPYDEIRPGRHHRFVTCHSSQEEEIRSLEDVETFHWPICMDFTGYPVRTPPPPSDRPAKIGIVTRLSREKPLLPFLHAFKALVSTVDATLHIYGDGDRSPLTGEIRALGLGDRVAFEGHREDLLAVLERDGLSMCWLMSVGSLVGYASLEIAATGMPMAFLNFGSPDTSSTESVRRETGGAIHAFHSIADFVEFSRACLLDRARLIEIGANLRRHILETHDISRNISALQEYYVRVADTVRPRRVERLARCAGG